MRRLALLAVLCVGLISLGADIIPLSEIEPGMTGYGLTVVAGTEISRFDVEVVGVLDRPGERNDFIIVRVSGPAITRSGGVAQGMSGSPIYLDGRLAGALSRAAAWASDRERPLALVTPIEPMLAVLAEVSRPPAEPVPLDGPRAADGDPLASLLSSPFAVSGLSPRALDALAGGVEFAAPWHPLSDLVPGWRTSSSGLRALGVSTLYSALPAQAGGPALGLVPGAPVGVALTTGDVTIGAVGTVTYADEGGLIAFGHHFLFTGPSRYFLTTAHVFDTIAAYDFSYKFGTVGEVVGGVYADRWAAVGGVVGWAPAGVSTSFRVRDAARDAEERLELRVADEPRLSALLLFASGLEATDRTLDRIGPGTVTVRYTLTGHGLPRPLVRENVFLSTQDIAPFVPWEMAMIADFLAYNEFADPRLATATLEATVQPGFSATEVLDLQTERDSYAPGDRVRFAVTLRGWRGETETWDGWVQIPATVDSPYVELRAYGGPRPRERGESPRILASLGDLLDFIDGIPTYDTLTVELFAVDPMSDVIGQTWLYGIDGVADRIPDTVVYGTVSVVLPIRERTGN